MTPDNLQTWRGTVAGLSTWSLFSGCSVERSLEPSSSSPGLRAAS